MSTREQLFKTARFIISTIIFLVAVVVALILARGNVITTGGLVTTGTIRLSIYPTDGITVFLDEQQQRLNSNNVIENVAPGEYVLRVQKENYSEWQQKVSVQANLVSDVSIQLFPKELKLTAITNTNIDKVFYSKDHKYAYYTVINSPIGNSVGLWQASLEPSVISLIEEQPVKLSNFTAQTRQNITDNKFEVIPSIDNRKLVVIDNGRYYILETGRLNEISPSNEIKFSYPIDEVKWLQSSSNLVIRSGNLLLDYDVNVKQTTLIYYDPDQTPVYTISQGNLIFSQDNALFDYANKTTTAIKVQNINIPSDIKQLVASDLTPQSVVIDSAEGVFFLNTNRSYITKLGDYDIVTFSPDGKTVILRKNDDFVSFTIDISEVLDQVSISHVSTDLKKSILLDSITWAPNSRFIIFAQDGEPNILYASSPQGQNIQKALESASAGENAIIATNNIEIIARLFDDNQSEGSDRHANLYRLKL